MLETVKAAKATPEGKQIATEQVWSEESGLGGVGLDRSGSALLSSAKCGVQSTEELDITEKEGEFLTKDSAEDKMARALSSGAAIRRVCPGPAWGPVHKAADSSRI